MAFPISDSGPTHQDLFNPGDEFGLGSIHQNLFNTGYDFGFDLDPTHQDLYNPSDEFERWIEPSVYSSPTSDMPSSPYTDVPLTPQSEFSVSRSQSLTGLENDIPMLSFDEEPMAQPALSPQDLDMGPGPWDYNMDDGAANEFPEQAHLFQFTPDHALTPPTTPPLPFLTTPSGPDYSSPATFHPPPSPSPPRPSRAKGGQTRKSAALARPKRAANSSGKPKIHFCDFPDCVVSCRRPCDLTKHKKRHLKPFKCRLCDSWSSSVKDRDRHELSLHQKGDHPTCEFPNCQHKTARKDNMANHVLRKHLNRGESLEDVGHLES